MWCFLMGQGVYAKILNIPKFVKKITTKFLSKLLEPQFVHVFAISTIQTTSVFF